MKVLNDDFKQSIKAGWLSFGGYALGYLLYFAGNRGWLYAVPFLIGYVAAFGWLYETRKNIKLGYWFVAGWQLLVTYWMIQGAMGL
jgi:hypothetical protein